MLEAASDTGYPFLNLMLTIAVFFAWMIWFWLLILVFRDLFGRSDISGWGKAAWTVFVIVLPYIGVLVYLITQDRHLGQRQRDEATAVQAQFDDHIREVSRSNGHAADDITKAKQLLDSGAISPGEFEALKKNALAS
ncbi:MAG TPA: PLDc N-terminal domain-containing protein [Pseudonocardiaceae bacterium]|nr:PLDc N-terminal domain-containing protein [Pseudonocardiaceae bacterium]